MLPEIENIHPFHIYVTLHFIIFGWPPFFIAPFCNITIDHVEISVGRITVAEEKRLACDYLEDTRWHLVDTCYSNRF